MTLLRRAAVGLALGTLIGVVSGALAGAFILDMNWVLATLGGFVAGMYLGPPVGIVCGVLSDVTSATARWAVLGALGGLLVASFLWAESLPTAWYVWCIVAGLLTGVGVALGTSAFVGTHAGVSRVAIRGAIVAVVIVLVLAPGLAEREPLPPNGMAAGATGVAAGVAGVLLVRATKYILIHHWISRSAGAVLNLARKVLPRRRHSRP
jgi:hypothetical protein